MLEMIERLLASLIVLAMLVLVFFIAFPKNSPTIQLEPFQLTIPSINSSIFWILILWGCILIVNLIFEFSEKHFFGVPNWSVLRAASENDIFKLSYAALIIIPILVYMLKLNFFNNASLSDVEIPLNTKISYFSALFFAFMRISYSICVPNIDINLEFDKSRLPMRWLCYVTFSYGVLLLLILLFRSARYVYYA
ncbi:MAG: hypothetical protein HC850_04695 [Rhodomicrobium sp.]|nr:hypothetical protein [Rhodomicrobium sp.]